MEVHLTGTWSEMVDGAVRKTTETRKYDGIGKSTREAKFAAATAALSKLKEHIPGIDYEVARRSSAEHLLATKALRCPATARMLHVAEGFFG